MISSRPAQAMRGGAVVVALAVAFRVPAIERQFADAVASVNRPTIAGGAAKPATVGVAAPLLEASVTPFIYPALHARSPVRTTGAILIVAARAAERKTPATASGKNLPNVLFHLRRRRQRP